jgi:hypothetical protein
MNQSVNCNNEAGYHKVMIIVNNKTEGQKSPPCVFRSNMSQNKKNKMENCPELFKEKWKVAATFSR